MVAALACVLVALLRLQSCFATGWSGRTPTTRMCPSDLAAAVGADNLGRGSRHTSPVTSMSDNRR